MKSYLTVIGNIGVSTCLTPEGYWETMGWRKTLSGSKEWSLFCQRYPTEDEAAAGHKEAVKKFSDKEFNFLMGY